MFGVSATTSTNMPAVQKAADNAAFKNIGHAAAGIRKDAVESIKPGDGPSPAGSPPNTHTQKTTKSGKTRKGVFPRAIAFDVSKEADDALIGFRESVVGLAGRAHELGDEFHGDSFPERPTLGPALERAIPRFGDSFEGSIGQ